MERKPRLSLTSVCRWLEFILPGLAYFVVARLSLFLAIPPSEAAAVWPAAGIAIGSILVRGWRVIPGLCIGVLVFNLSLWLDTGTASALLSSLSLSLLLTFGTLLQALLSTRLVHHYLGAHNPLIEERTIVLFLILAGPVGCLTAATFNMPVLLAFGILPPSEFLFNWLNWWVGDSVGVIVIASIILVAFASKEHSPANRKYAVGIPLLILLMLVFALFSFVQRHDKSDLMQAFDKEVTSQHGAISSGTSNSLDILYFLKGFFEASNSVSERDFADFTRQSVLQNTHIHALEWIPRIPHEQRPVFEQHADAPRLITEPDSEGNMTGASDRAVYFPIKYAQPLRGNNRIALGYDVFTNPDARRAIEKAIEQGVPVATTPIRLIQENENQKGMVIYLPVLASGRNNNLDAEVSGLVAAVFRLEDFIRTVSGARSSQPRLVSQHLIDLSESGETLYQSPDLASSLELYQRINLKISRTVNVAGRLWLIDYFPNQNFVDTHTSWASWLVLIGGMLFTTLLGGWLLLLTGRNIRVNQIVSEKTAFLHKEIEQRKRIESEITKLSLAVEHSPNMVVVTDAQGIIEYVNPKFTLLTGYELAEVLGRNISILHSGDLDGYSYETIWKQLAETHEWQGEVLNSKKDGEFYWAEIHIAAIINQQSECTNYVSVHQDVTESKLISDKISHQASHDLLTGLINRREFERRLEHLMQTAKAEQHEHAFCFLDLDQFKVVNDTSGHVAGDELLRQLGAMLQEKIRRSDTIARLGGDEFGILMEQCSLSNAQRMAEEIREAIEQFKFRWNDRTHSIGVSIGLVNINQNSHNSIEVFKQVDSACYMAKDSGRNRIHLYQEDDEMQARRIGEIHWVTDINEALDEDRFELYGQLIKPIQSLDRKPGVEILLRLKNKDGSLVPPGAFLPAAERYYISTRIDLWVINHVFDWLESEPAVMEKIATCAINLSGQSLGDKAILQAVTRQLSRHVVPPEMIKFEITETSAIGNLTEAKDFINAVKKYGCLFSLDDFGSGLSSFAYLKHLSVDVLKIDGLFVKDIMHDEIDLAMVKSINEVGHVMGMETIAEFVENDEILNRLAEIGVDYAQGYGVCRPMPLAELMAHALLNRCKDAVIDQDEWTI